MRIIAAQAKDGAIGNRGGLLASLPTDMKHFREETTGHTVVMGRATLESFPGGRPLPKRRNIVLSTTLPESDSYEVVRSVEDLLELLGTDNGDDVYVIGGGQIYSRLLPYCGSATITEIEGEFEADTYMPVLAELDDWELISRSERMEENGCGFTFAEYRRKQAEER